MLVTLFFPFDIMSASVVNLFVNAHKIVSWILRRLL